MSRPLSLSIEGEGRDGQILIVDEWPSFKVVDMPKAKVVEKPYPVYRDFRGEPYKPGIPEAVGLLFIVLWLAVLTTSVTMMATRINNENPKA